MRLVTVLVLYAPGVPVTRRRRSGIRQHVHNHRGHPRLGRPPPGQGSRHQARQHEEKKRRGEESETKQVGGVGPGSGASASANRNYHTQRHGGCRLTCDVRCDTCATQRGVTCHAHLRKGARRAARWAEQKVEPTGHKRSRPGSTLCPSHTDTPLRGLVHFHGVRLAHALRNDRHRGRRRRPAITVTGRR